jgi:nucleoside 2-deoxyribosyltransferase
MDRQPVTTGDVSRKESAMPTKSTNSKAGSPVYLAGPMFSSADLWQQTEIDAILKKAGFTTYFPHRDGLEVASVMHRVNVGLALPPAQVLEVVTLVHKMVFALDVFQLVERCESVLFGLDGRVPDDGAVSETAIAFAADKPIVIFKTTPISMLGGWDNPMVQGLSTEWGYVSDARKIPAALNKARAAQAKVKGPAAQAGPRLAATVALGETIWNSIGMLHKMSAASPKVVYSTVKKLESKLHPLLSDVF